MDTAEKTVRVPVLDTAADGAGMAVEALEFIVDKAPTKLREGLRGALQYGRTLSRMIATLQVQNQQAPTEH